MRSVNCLSLWLLLFYLATCSSLLSSSATGADSVSIETGKVSGIPSAKDASITVYKGIPFAAPPVGKLRWKAPQPATSWDDVRVCDKFGSAAIQPGNRSGNKSEDCLYLNVWTPEQPTSEKLPVMVWIHGGGLRTGSGHKDGYDGTQFAKRGVVLVTINYRLGALGYFAHPELSDESPNGVSGNYGFLDQIAALKWVQKNIDSFGGDPSNVTIFGESAGGTSVYVLTASPLAKGLFHRAILQSPWLDPNIFVPLKSIASEESEKPKSEPKSVERLGQVAAELLVSGSDQVSQLREMSAEDIQSELKVRNIVSVDGHFMPKYPELIFAEGSHNQVPTIAGTNRDEGTMFAGGAQFKSIEQFEAEQRDRFAEHADEILELYRVTEPSKIRKSVVQMITDGWFVQPTRQYIRGVAGNGGKAWMYHFQRVSPTWPMLGAAHAAEIGFVFNTLPKNKMKGADAKIADAMISYWVQFAKSGDPNAADLHEWPAYNLEDDQHLVIDAELTLDSGLRQQACDVLDSIRVREEAVAIP